MARYHVRPRIKSTSTEQNDPTLLRYAIQLEKISFGTPKNGHLDFIWRRLTLSERKKIHNKLCRAIKARRDSKRILQSLENAYEHLATDCEDYFRILGKNLDLRSTSFFKESINDGLAFIQMRIDRLQEKKIQSRLDERQDRLERLGKMFSLSKKELEILEFFLLLETNSEVYNMANLDDLDMGDFAKSIKIYCRFFDLQPHDLRNFMARNGTLCRAGLLERSKRDATISITNHMVAFLTGTADDQFSNNLFNVKEGACALGLEDFPIPNGNINVMKELMRGDLGASILLYGAPGAGKTEFSRTIADACGLTPYFVSQANDDGKESLEFRKSALVAAQNLLKKENCLLVIDECDPIINTKAGLFSCDDKDDDGKSWINHYLETSQLKSIWISNRVNGLDESTQRRFSYAQSFRIPNAQQRLKAWNIQAEIHKVDFLGDEKRRALADRYEVSPGNIALALRDVGSMGERRSVPEKTTFVENILKQKEILSSGKRSKQASLTGKYSLEAINTDVPLETITASVREFLHRSGEGSFEVKNLNLLLMGPPGTGKTEYVKSLASNSGRDLLVKRTSDLLGAYVGQTERSIADAFAEAEERNAILFLDEADSLFIDRSEASRSWEVSQTNELLCQMENFDGVLACATNFQDNLDIAALRRFAFKVKFSYMRPEQQLAFFRSYFSEKISQGMTMEQEARLRRIAGLAPGDFKVTRQKFYFVRDVGVDTLIESLEREAESRIGRSRRPISGLQG